MISRPRCARVTMRFDLQCRTVKVGLALAAGLAWALAAPPRGWWPLLPLGVGALALALRGQGARGRLLCGALAGGVFYAPTLRWLTDFSVPGYVAVMLLETGLLAAAAAVVPAAGSGRWSRGWWALPAALVLLEAVQTRFPWGGFPLPALVLSQPGGPFAAVAPLGGSLLVTALAAASGVALAALVVVPQAARRLAVAGTALVFAVAPWGAGPVLDTQPAGTVDAAVVQGGGPRGTRAVFTDPGEVTARQLEVLGAVSGRPDLVVLPENVVHVEGRIAGTLPDQLLADQARRLHTTVVAGVVETDDESFRNAAVAWGPDGRRIGRYEKEHRVPFGEYIPGRELLEQFTDATALVPRDALVGHGEALLPSPAGPLGVVISYEVFFADRVREAVAAGGQVVLVPTNAASYATADVPAMELAAARLRAREVGRAVLQAAPTGYSAVVMPNGEVVARSALGAPGLLRHEVPLRTGLTLYSRIGDVPLIAVAAAVLVVPPLLSTRRRARSAGVQTAPSVRPSPGGGPTGRGRERVD
jgi:apolipoprotein N-acyltransferase